MRYAQARNAIERAFGVLKCCFSILMDAPEYSIKTQARIVLACCTTHNFIRHHNDPDDDPEGLLEGAIAGTDVSCAVRSEANVHDQGYEKQSGKKS